jgi:methanogenic corrinoid protein MtbC1
LSDWISPDARPPLTVPNPDPRPTPNPATEGAAQDAAEDTARHAELFWQALASRDERAALAVALGALDAGLGAETVLLDVVAVAQRRVGSEWAANRFTVAQEHAATAISERVVSVMTAQPRVLAERSDERGRITVACADGEWHGLPARLLAELLTLRGWRVDYLGAHVPVPHLVVHLHETGPAALGLSSSLSTRLPAAHAMIMASQAATVPVIVGGAAFGSDGRYARLLGADAWAPDARAAADRLAVPLPAPAFPRQAAETLPHLLDGEYTLVSRSRPRLVGEVLAELPKQFPAMRSYTEQQMQYTAEDIAHVVEHLACALYVNDEELFTWFIAWTASILQARRVPVHSLDAALRILRERLREFPRASAFLTGALVVTAGDAA